MVGVSHISHRSRLTTIGLAVFLCWNMGCGGSGGAGAGGGAAFDHGEPEGKARLAKVLRLYQVYSDKNKVGPPSEQALRDFGHKLSAKERDEYLIGDDLDNIFTSPRDNEKFVIRFSLKLQPGGATRAIAWEANGKDGKRFVALTTGYVDEYDEETFKEYSK
jgi:hypothetical protein